MTPKDVLKMAKEKGARIVDLRFIDLPGLWQHFSIPVSELSEGIFSDGLGFDGSSIRGFQTIDESDMLLIPDPSTAQMDPYTAVPTLVLICNVKDPITGKAYTRDPRYVAQKAEAYVKKSGAGDTIYIGPELEFFFFDSIRFDQSYNYGYYFIDSEAGAWNSGREGTPDRPNLGYKPRYKQGYFPVPPMDHFQDIRSDMVLALESVGIRVEVHHHEVATGGQTEIDMRFDTLTKMADRVCWYKYCAKNTAKKWGKTATFMPKPLFQDNGSGMHTHQSIWKNGKNLFYERGGYADISKMCLYYIGGILKHAPALLAFIAPSTNSYKRLVPGYEAPINLVYSQRNRSAAIRIPMYSKAEGAKRIEFRTPDPTCNPYLSFAACVMAGLDGVANKIDPGKPVDKDLYELPPPSRRRSSSSLGPRHRPRQPGEGPRLPPQGRCLHPRPDRDVDRVQAEERGGPRPAASASLRVRPLLRHLERPRAGRPPAPRRRGPLSFTTWGRTAPRLRLAPARGEERVHRGEGEEGEGGGGDEAADDHAGERLLDLRADAVAEGGGEEADHGHDGGDDDGPEADLAAAHDGLAEGQALREGLADRRDEHGAVEHADAEDRDVAHGGRDVEVALPEVQGEGSPMRAKGRLSMMSSASPMELKAPKSRTKMMKTTRGTMT